MRNFAFSSTYLCMLGNVKLCYIIYILHLLWKHAKRFSKLGQQLLHTTCSMSRWNQMEPIAYIAILLFFYSSSFWWCQTLTAVTDIACLCRRIRVAEVPGYRYIIKKGFTYVFLAIKLEDKVCCRGMAKYTKHLLHFSLRNIFKKIQRSKVTYVGELNRLVLVIANR